MNIDIEGHHVLLVPTPCEACLLRKRRTTMPQNLRYCLLVAYNILLLSVVFVTLWYIHDCRDRLERNERIIETLQQQQQNRRDTHDAGYSSESKSLSVLEDDVGYQLHGSNDDDYVVPAERPNIRIKRGKNTRRPKKKRCKNCLPVVQLEGMGGEGHEDKRDLSYLWNTPSPFIPTGKKKNFDVSNVSKTGRIKIIEGGLYLMYAQMNLVGPSVKGFEVFKEDHNSAPECLTTCKRNSELDFTENCFTMKAVRLEPNSSVFVQEMELNRRANYLSKSTYFGLIKMTLAGQSKRGYHIKKEHSKQITTIASCALYINEVGMSKNDANVLLRTCPTMRAVTLVKGDQVFIEEIDDNSVAQYSEFSVFGLIRIAT